MSAGASTTSGVSPAISNAPSSTLGKDVHQGSGGRHFSRQTSNTQTKHQGRPAHNKSAAGSPNVHVMNAQGSRILCVSDIRGNFSLLNTMAEQVDAQAVIHSGDFGFYEKESFDRISDRTLRHLVQYSPLLPDTLKSELLFADSPNGRVASGPGQHPPPSSTPCKEMRARMLSHPDSPLITDFPKYLKGEKKFKVPVYTIWGACEDVRILEKIRIREYSIPNLHVLDEASTVALDVGGVRLRLFGLGGAVVLHKLFDNGEGAATVAGGQGTMWTTLLQIGELYDTAQKCYDPKETRLLITHNSPGRESLLMQLAVALKADFTISGALHFRYPLSYNEFGIQSDTEQFRRKLLQSKTAFNEVWDSVRNQVEEVVDENQRILLKNGLAITNRVPQAATATGAVHEEPAWKNLWNWNLPDAVHGHLVLDIRDGQMGTEMKGRGFNLSHRRSEGAAPELPVSPSATPKTSSGPAAPSPAKSTQLTAGDTSATSRNVAKSARIQHTPNGSSRGSTGPHESTGSRPSSSKGPKGPRDSKSEPILPESSLSAPDNTRTEGRNGLADPQVPTPTKKSSSKPKSHRSKKSGTSTVSNRSEKSGSENEAKQIARETKSTGKGDQTASSQNETTTRTERDSEVKDQTGDRRSRGGGRGRGRGGRGRSGQHSSSHQEHLKSGGGSGS